VDRSSSGTSTLLSDRRENVATPASKECRSMYADKDLTCSDCGQQFVFSESEQQFYADRGFTEPRRCPSCRAARKSQQRSSGSGGGYGDTGSSYGGSGYSRGPREMFDATCSNCGKATQVPFRPTQGKPVYCNECFATRR
jgi:CxxC-x17-CxxC domain-containing protein